MQSLISFVIALFEVKRAYVVSVPSVDSVVVVCGAFEAHVSKANLTFEDVVDEYSQMFCCLSLTLLKLFKIILQYFERLN